MKIVIDNITRKEAEHAMRVLSEEHDRLTRAKGKMSCHDFIMQLTGK